jgi:hypothetical protein
MRLVLGNGSLINHPQAGGHWSWFLQYPLGLRALGHDVHWLELMRSTGQADEDARIVRQFFELIAPYGLDQCCAVLIFDCHLDFQPFERAQTAGRSKAAVEAAIRDADLLLNFCCAIRQPLLSTFRYRALLDFDPGHLQISALSWDMAVANHEALLTIGGRINAPDCEVPKLDLKWRTFEPCVYLPMWPTTGDPGRDAPFTSVTHWTWEELPWRGRIVSVSKRTAYLNYVDLPRRARRPFELAAYIEPTDATGDRELLTEHNWRIVHPYDVVSSVGDYQQYIGRSRAEFMCPKPIHVEMKTGWFSDRSIAYLASGRPVLAQESGFSERIPTGSGLLMFRDMDEAVAGVAEIDGNYYRHSRASRELAEDLFDSQKCLAAMLSACEL